MLDYLKLYVVAVALACVGNPLQAAVAAGEDAPGQNGPSTARRAHAVVVPEAARAYFVLGRKALRLAKVPADYAKAAQEFSRAANLAPAWKAAWYELSVSDEAAGDYTGAATGLSRFRSLTSDPTESRMAGARADELSARSRGAAAAGPSGNSGPPELGDGLTGRFEVPAWGRPAKDAPPGPYPVPTPGMPGGPALAMGPDQNGRTLHLPPMNEKIKGFYVYYEAPGAAAYQKATFLPVRDSTYVFVAPSATAQGTFRFQATTVALDDKESKPFEIR